MKNLVRGAVLAGVLGILTAAAAWTWISLPYQGFGNEKFVDIERGTGTKAIASQLASAGVLRHPWQFVILRALKPGVALQAGEYRFDAAVSAREVFARLARGDVYHFDFTVPEGSNVFDIARLLDEQEVLPSADFLNLARDPDTVKTLLAGLDSNARTLEGYLYPSTYRLSHTTTAADLCRMMVAAFRKEWTRLGAPADGAHRAVTLASLVEKETGVAEERPLVASVFTNRLKTPMRLDCDPTVIYAALLEQRFSGVIHRSDLNARNPYNTYQNDGLPPGPIANPGSAALQAALQPAQTDYLYFVAKPEGGSHVFSATLAAHQKAVASYRHGLKTQGNKEPHGNSGKSKDASKPARKAG